MAVESIGSSSTFYSGISRQNAEARQSTEVRSSEEPPVTNPQERVEPAEEAPKPVKNAEGQTTGTRINVTA